MIPFDFGSYSTIVFETIAKVRALIPGFTVDFPTTRSQSPLESFESGQSDIAIIFTEPYLSNENQICELMLSTPFMIWAHKDNPALVNEHPRLEDFSDSKLVRSNTRLFEGFYDAETEILTEHGIALGTRVKNIQNMADFYTMMQPDEIKITCASDISCPYNSDIVGIPYPEEALRFNIFFVYKSNAEDPILNLFLETCRQTARNYEGRYLP